MKKEFAVSNWEFVVGDVVLRRRMETSDWSDPDLVYENWQRFNQQHLQFEVAFEIPEENVIITEELIANRREQVTSQIREHGLAQPKIEKMNISLVDGQLVFPFQKEDCSFVEEVMRSSNPSSLFRTLDPYLTRRFGRPVSVDDLIEIRSEPDLVRDLVSDLVFYRTTIGLELSEFVGLIELEKKLMEMKPGQVVVEVSPAEPELRRTEVLHNWFRIYEKQDDGSISASYVKTFDDFATVWGQYRELCRDETGGLFVQDLVSSPLLVDGSVDDVLAIIGFNADPEFIGTYDDAMEDPDVVDAIEAFVHALCYRTMSNDELNRVRKELETFVFEVHKRKVEEYLDRGGDRVSDENLGQIRFYQQFYGRGGGCGLDGGLPGMLGGGMSAESGQLGVVLYGNPSLPDRWFCESCEKALHCIDEHDQSTWFECCQGCGASGRC